MLSTVPEKQNKKARLLCVDDDLCFLMLFTAVLESAGYCVVATNDPNKGLELATGTGFDLIVLDYDMPGMNGAELAHEIKQRKCDLPIILFSGNTSVPAEALGVVDDVVKGESVGSFLQTLRLRSAC
jgi:CheY-like chemotaxis protein